MCDIPNKNSLRAVKKDTGKQSRIRSITGSNLILLVRTSTDIKLQPSKHRLECYHDQSIKATRNDIRLQPSGCIITHAVIFS